MQQPNDQSAASKPTDKLSGPQGNDKAPGEDAADQPDTKLDIQHTQKAKKVDADPEAEAKNPD